MLPASSGEMKMLAARFSETSVFYRTIKWSHKPEVHDSNPHRRESNLGYLLFPLVPLSGPKKDTSNSPSYWFGQHFAPSYTPCPKSMSTSSPTHFTLNMEAA